MHTELTEGELIFNTKINKEHKLINLFNKGNVISAYKRDRDKSK